MQQPMPRQPEPEFMDDAGEAEAYALSDFSEVNQAFVDRLLELVPSGEALKAVDLGTGPGDIPIRVALARPDWQIAAVDASQAMLDFAREAAHGAHLGDRIDWVLADAKDTRLRAGGFDVVFSNSILHHVNDTESFWTELKRLSKPGAMVFLRDLFRPKSPESARKIVGTYGGVGPKLMQEEYYRSLLSAYTPEEVRGQLARAGLTTLEVECVTDRHMDIFGRLC